MKRLVIGLPAVMGLFIATILSSGLPAERVRPNQEMQRQRFSVPEPSALRSVHVGESLLREDLEQGRAWPTALASGDFDEDGVTDLVCAYGAPAGGVVVLHRGNGAAVSGDTPFHSPSRVFDLPVPPDFLGAGDFDNDGHLDLIAAAEGGARLYPLRGDGRGGVVPLPAVGVPGRIVSMIAGEINRPDHLQDLVVAVRGEAGPSVAVFEGPEGVLSAEPEWLTLPADAGALALGKLDDDPWIDLVVTADRELWIVHGRDRWMSEDETAPARIDRITLEETTIAVATGEFRSDPRHRQEIAVLSDSGTMLLLHRDGHPDETRWRIGAERFSVGSSASSRLVSGRVSGLPTEDLVIFDPAEARLRVWIDGRDDPPSTIVEAEPVAVLPMRLNGDAMGDLVLLSKGTIEPSVAMSAVQSVITVNTGGDSATAADGVCSLREAIANANLNGDTTGGDCTAGLGADVIGFAVAGGGAPATISIFSPLPVISDLLTLDGTTQGCALPPCIAIDGTLAGLATHGLQLSAGSTTVRGLAIHGFDGHGILIDSAGNFVEGSHIGTNLGGTLDLGNVLDGIHITGAAGNTVGGTAPGAGNLISGNGLRGVTIELAGSTGNTVLGNLIGTTAGGAADLGNTDDGVLIQEASANTLGGTAAGAGNVISGNDSDGVYILGAGATGNTVLGNLIGTAATGSIALGNGDDGVQVQDAPGNTIGGTAAGARNVISANGDEGVVLILPGATGNLVQGNLIGTQLDGSVDLGNASDGVLIQNASDNVIGGTVAAARNVISGNDDDGVAITSGSTGNDVVGNYIGTNAAGTADLGNTDDGVLIQGASTNVIGGALAGASNVIAGNDGDGISIRALSSGNQVVGNLIGTDSGGTADLGNTGNGVTILDSANTTVGGTAPGSRNVISGNDADGLSIAVGASGTQVQGNYIGVDAGGALILGNGDNGIDVDDAPGNVIGGAGAESRNVISGNGSDGVFLFASGSSGNQVQGNYIGTSASGTADLGNASDGIRIQDAPGNFIGGAGPGEGNLISGNNDEGVSIVSVAAAGNIVRGNLIGTDRSGMSALGNSSDGISVQGAPTNEIGGAIVGAGNVISGNGGDGIAVLLAASTGNKIEGNLIGTDVNGTGLLGNGDDGVQIQNASSTTVGGASAAAGNVISGNGTDGLFILSPAATGNLVQGNLIGTDATGIVAMANGAHGVNIQDAPGNTVGGATVGARNVLSGNGASGIHITLIGASGNVVQGNFVGIDFNGGALGNSEDGIEILNAPNNIIGGTSPGSGNVVSGNGNEGIAIVSPLATGNLVQGNFVGTDPTGLLALGNSSDGIAVRDAASNTVGGLTAAARNVVSGNGNDGVAIRMAGATGNLVLGNYIGTDVTGTADLGNEDDGIQVNSAPGNTIGGTATGSGNLVSGNDGDGIEIFSAGATGNVVSGNLIGTDFSGTAAIGNSSDGVVVQAAASNTIGGATPEARNVIAGNEDDGVMLSVGATDNRIQGNYIGTDVGGVSALPNLGDGVQVTDSTDNTIGGLSANEANRIRSNGGRGVYVRGTSDTIMILRNSISGNGGLGVALDSFNVLPNDSGDLDLGPNELQNYPVLSVTTSSDLGTNIDGTLNSVGSGNYRLEFYSSPACDSSGHGEGESFVEFVDVATDLAGNVNFATTFPAEVPVGHVMTVTASRIVSGLPPVRASTSEFSACSPVLSTIQLDKFLSANADEDASGDVSLGDTLTFTFSATNIGLVALNGITVDDLLPGMGPLDCGGVTDLLPSEFLTCTATYVVTAADVTAGLITNTATTAAFEPAGGEVGDLDVERVCVGAIDTPSLSLAKQGPDALLSWTAVAGAAAYDVVRGDLNTLTANGGDFSIASEECAVDDETDLSFVYSGDPAATEGFFFIVRRGDCANGTYDSNAATQVGDRDVEVFMSGAGCS